MEDEEENTDKSCFKVPWTQWGSKVGGSRLFGGNKLIFFLNDSLIKAWQGSLWSPPCNFPDFVFTGAAWVLE